MIEFPKRLQEKLERRRENNTLRDLSVQSVLVDFYSNDYLGFAKDASIANRASLLLKDQSLKNGSTGSRLISGTTHLHIEVEEQIAQFHQADAGLLFNSGYDANVGLFSALLQKKDILLFDELIHASVRDGVQMSYAKSYKFKHNNVADLENKLQKFKKDGVVLYVAVESVYSMDGDIVPLAQIANLCLRYQAYLIVDEAHSGGVLGEQGKGLVCHQNLEKQIFARVHTFGKALGCHGAIVLGSTRLREYLINFSRSFIYTTAIPLHAVATLKSAYGVLVDTDKVRQLQDVIHYFAAQVEKMNLESAFIKSNSPIQCCIVSGNNEVKKIALKIKNKGFQVKAVTSPTVPRNKERLRICLHAYNSKIEIKGLLLSIKEEIID